MVATEVVKVETEVALAVTAVKEVVVSVAVAVVLPMRDKFELVGQR